MFLLDMYNKSHYYKNIHFLIIMALEYIGIINAFSVVFSLKFLVGIII